MSSLYPSISKRKAITTILFAVGFFLVSVFFIAKQTDLIGFLKFDLRSKASNDLPMVIVQIHTWWDRPSSPYEPKDWGYYKDYTNNNPDTTYQNSSFPQRRISSYKYPESYNGNQLSKTSDLLDPDISNASSSGSYQLIGPYDLSDPEIARYQIRLAKKAGITAFAVSVFDLYSDPQPNVCPKASIPHITSGLDRFETLLNAAEAESFKVFLEYWIPFRNSNDPNSCGSLPSWKRSIVNAVNKYKQRSAYLKIDNQPVISVGAMVNLSSAAQDIQSQTGDLFWLVRRFNPDEARNATIIDSYAAYTVFEFLSNSNPTLVDSPNYGLMTRDLSEQLSLKNQGLKSKTVAHIYPGFDDSFRTKIPDFRQQKYRPLNMKRTDSQGNNVLAKQLNTAVTLGYDIIFIESWNDIQEQTQIEPSRLIGGELQADPYLALRTLATALRSTFTPPPFPPKSSLDTLPPYYFRPAPVPPAVARGASVDVSCDFGVRNLNCVWPRTGTGFWKSCTFTGTSGDKYNYRCIAPTESQLSSFKHQCIVGGTTNQGCMPYEAPPLQTINLLGAPVTKTPVPTRWIPAPLPTETPFVVPTRRLSPSPTRRPSPSPTRRPTPTKSYVIKVSPLPTSAFDW